MQQVIAIGDPFNGLTLIGPFSDEQEAMNYADQRIEDTEWLVVPIQTPNTGE